MGLTFVENLCVTVFRTLCVRLSFWGYSTAFFVVVVFPGDNFVAVRASLKSLFTYMFCGYSVRWRSRVCMF